MEADKILPFAIPSANNSIEEVLVLTKKMLNSKKYVEGTNVKRLETVLARRYKRKVVAVSSGTAGLIVALDSILKDKKEVIVPSLSFSATIQAIIHAGGEPIFADISEENWTLDPEDTERKITEKTGAIMPVNLFGVPCNTKAFLELGKRYNIPIVYDSCQAFGARTQEGEVGTFGDIEVFSLDATKILSAGLGGFITVKDNEIYNKVILAKNFGNDLAKIPQMRGINARMPEFLAILACNNLLVIEENLRRIREVATVYRKVLSGIPHLKFQRFDENCSSPQYFSVFLDHPNPEIGYLIKEKLLEKGIEIRVYNPSNIHKKPFFTNKDVTLNNTEKMCAKIICLPTHEKVTETHVGIIKKIIEEVLR